MKDPKKVGIAAGAVLAILLGGFVVFKTLSGANPDTNAGAQDEAKAMVKSRNQTDKMSDDQYKELMSKARGFGSKGGHTGP